MAPWWEDVLCCPVCGAGVKREGNSLFCLGARGRVHCFDFSAAGHVNLAPAVASGGGDDKDLIAARTAFLGRGHYAPLAARINAILQKHADGKELTVLDAGCGEGYYAREMARGGMRVLGVDLSKRGITHAAKAVKGTGLQALFAVAGIFTLPVADNSLDALVSVFAPVGEEEFLRVLKPGGLLLLVGAGERHLFSLKEVLYRDVYENKPRADLPQRMTLLSEEKLSFDMPLSGEDLWNLFSMTPYFYRTPREGVERLKATEALTVGADMQILVYQKP